MVDITTAVRDLHRGDTLRIATPAVGDVTVLVPHPRESTRVEPGVEHLVFTRPNGRMVGLNWAPTDADPAWEECTLVADDDGYQHALLVRANDEVRLLTRREPGRPDDWEDRGRVTALERVDDSTDRNDD